MSAVPTILWSLVLAGGVLAAVLYLLNILLQSNLRKLFEYLHLDTILARFVKYAREHKIFWFFSGVLLGALITSVILPYITAANEPYINPIHDARAKWNIVKWISGGQGNVEPLSMVKLEPCHIVIVRLSVAYAEDFARDWTEISGAIEWTVTEKLADTPIDKGITLRPIQAEGKAVACANALNTTFSQYALSKRGYPVGGTHIYSYANQTWPLITPKSASHLASKWTSATRERISKGGLCGA
jgi:hypothetical protein